jgi:hypothetical protein
VGGCELARLTRFSADVRLVAVPIEQLLDPVQHPCRVAIDLIGPGLASRKRSILGTRLFYYLDSEVTARAL